MAAVMHEACEGGVAPRVGRLLERIQHEGRSRRGGTRQSPMRRAKTSITKATNTKPSQVATYVKSDTLRASAAPTLCRRRRTGGSVVHPLSLWAQLRIAPSARLQRF